MSVDPFRHETVARADASPALGTNNLAWRAGHLRALGGFLEGTSASEDRDFAARAGAVGHFAVFMPVVVHHNREYSGKDPWRRYGSGPFPGGGRRGVGAIVRSFFRLPRALARDLLAGAGALSGPPGCCRTEGRCPLRGRSPRCHFPRETGRSPDRTRGQGRCGLNLRSNVRGGDWGKGLYAVATTVLALVLLLIWPDEVGAALRSWGFRWCWSWRLRCSRRALTTGTSATCCSWQPCHSCWGLVLGRSSALPGSFRSTWSATSCKTRASSYSTSTHCAP